MLDLTSDINPCEVNATEWKHILWPICLLTFLTIAVAFYLFTIFYSLFLWDVNNLFSLLDYFLPRFAVSAVELNGVLRWAWWQWLFEVRYQDFLSFFLFLSIRDLINDLICCPLHSNLSWLERYKNSFHGLPISAFSELLTDLISENIRGPKSSVWMQNEDRPFFGYFNEKP